MAIVTSLYILANLAYISVLTPTEIISANAVAVTFGGKITPVLFYIIPCFVALSAFGGLNSNIMNTSRLLLVASRQNHLPSLFSLVGQKSVSPIPSILFGCFLSIFLITTNSIDTLILYTTYAGVLGTALAICAQIYLRLTRKNLHLPLRLPIVVPILFLLALLVVLILPFTIPDKRLGVGMSFIIIASGIPVYFIFIWWKNKPKCFAKLDNLALKFCQKMIDGLPETVDPLINCKTD